MLMYSQLLLALVMCVLVPSRDRSLLVKETEGRIGRVTLMVDLLTSGQPHFPVAGFCAHPPSTMLQ
jgi:hypothetical protein